MKYLLGFSVFALLIGWSDEIWSTIAVSLQNIFKMAFLLGLIGALIAVVLSFVKKMSNSYKWLSVIVLVLYLSTVVYIFLGAVTSSSRGDVVFHFSQRAQTSTDS
jgi:uncharacterized protein YacL